MGKTSSNDDTALDDILRRQKELEDQIAAVEAVPEQLELEIRENERTIPAPDDLVERRRKQRFEEQATRGQIRNERRTQGRSLFLMFLMLAATAAIISWIMRLSAN